MVLKLPSKMEPFHIFSGSKYCRIDWNCMFHQLSSWNLIRDAISFDYVSQSKKVTYPQKSNPLYSIFNEKSIPFHCRDIKVASMLFDIFLSCFFSQTEYSTFRQGKTEPLPSISSHKLEETHNNWWYLYLYS